MTKRASSAASSDASKSTFKKGKVQNSKNNFNNSIVDSGGQRFRFKNFNDRIEDIDISSIQRIGGYRGPGPQSTDSTWFELSFEAWQELNCTTPFAQFCYAVRPLMGTLPRLLFNRDRIVKEIFSVLNSAAASPDSPARLALIPVLSLTAMLAKDLGSDFLIFFSEFYSLLTEILPQSSDPEVIEAAFASLLYVFKCLLPDLVSDLSGTFKTISSTALNLKSTGASTAHIKRFSAQCFGYLLRKSVNICTNSSDFIRMITSESEEFLAESLFSAIFDESTGRFRTCLKPLYFEIFTATFENECWVNVLRFLSVKLLDASDLNTNGPFWKIIIQLLNSPVNENEQSRASSSFEVLRKVLIDCFAYRRGTRVQFHDQLIPGVMKINSLELTAYFMRSMNLEITLQNRAQVMKLIETVLYGDFSKLTTLSKFLVKINWLHYDLILSGIVIKFVKTQESGNYTSIVELLTVLLPKYPNAPLSLLQSVPNLLINLAASSIAGVELLILHFPHNIPSNLVAQYRNEFKSIILESGKVVDVQKLRLCTEILEKSIQETEASCLEISDDVFIKFVSKNLLFSNHSSSSTDSSSFSVLKSIEVAIKTFNIKFSPTNLQELIYNHLLPILHFASSQWRIESLHLLEILLSNQQSPEYEVVQVLKEIEEIPEDLQNYREKLLKLKKLEHLPLVKKAAAASETTESKSNSSIDNDDVKVCSNLQQLLVLHYLLGFLQIKLSLLSAEGNRILSVYAKAFSNDFATLLTQLFKEFNLDISEGSKRSRTDSSTITKRKETVSYSYDIDVDDEFLNRLERIRVEVASKDIEEEEEEENNDKFTSNDALNSESLLLPVILKAFSLYPEICLKEHDFREQIFFPLIFSTFSTTSTSTQTPNEIIAKILQSHLICIFKTIAGCRVDFERETERNLEEILLKFLSHGDLNLQICALDALFSMKRFGAALSNQWKARLKSLLNENMFREELTNLTSEAASLPSVTHWNTLLVPLIVRILFGRFISRRGAAAGRHSLPLRRKMIMNCFGTWDTDSLAHIVDFLLENLKDSTDTAKQIGFLNTLENVFSSLARNLDDASMDRLISVLISVFESTETIEHIDECDNDNNDDYDDDESMEEEQEADLNDSMEVEVEESKEIQGINTTIIDDIQEGNNDKDKDERSTAPSKRIRQLIMKRLLQLFKLYDSSSFTRLRPFLPILFTKIFNPRIERLSSEFVNADKSSALMEIFVCWASCGSVEDLNEIFTVFSPDLWKNLILCFSNPRTKPLILDQILTVFEGLILKGKSNAAESSILMKNIVLPQLNNLLDALDYRLKTSSKNFKFVFRVLSLIQSLTPHVTSSELAGRLITTFEGLLKIRTINESARTNLISSLIPLISLTNQVTDNLYEVVSTQWNVLTGRQSRVALCKFFSALPQIQPERPYLQTLAESLENLNAWQAGRVSEPDFDRRLTAFAQLRRFIESKDNNWKNEYEIVQFFTPILYEMIHGLKDIEELSIRNQSFGVLKTIIKVLQSLDDIPMMSSKFTSIIESDDECESESESGIESESESEDLQADIIEDVKEKTKIAVQVNSNNSAYFKLIHNILLPSIKFGLKSSFEPIRIEFVSLLDLLISSFPNSVPFSTLHSLIKTDTGITGFAGVEDIDEEHNIFRNIYHIQEPRRTWAIRKIGELAIEGKLQGITRSIIEDLLLPLVLGTALPNLNSEAPFEVSEAMQKDSIATAGCLLAQLPWRPFLSKLIHYVREISSNKRSQEWSRAVLRLLPSMISQFVAPVAYTEIADFQNRVNESVLPAMFRLLHKSETATPDADNKKLAKTASGGPMVDKISVKHSLRVPIAIAIGQLIKVVSQGSLDSLVVVNHLPKLLNALLNVLKLKDADTREVARGALVKILGIFGTSYLPFFLKEAKILLNKGYQRHVLTFTSHAILIELLRKHKQSDEKDRTWNLDSCAGLLVDMALASSFGCQAAERAAIEWSGKQPEVRAAKGPEIIALTVQFTSQAFLKDVVFSKIFKIACLELEDSTTFNTRGTGATDEKAQRIESVEGETFDELLRSFFNNGLHPLLNREPERLPYLLEMMYQVLSVPSDSGSKSHIHRLQARAFEFISFVLTSSSVVEANDLGLIVPFIGLTREYILEKGKHVDAITASITLFNQFISFKALHPSITDLQPLLQKLFTIILKGSSQSVQISAAYRLTSTLIRDWSELEVNDTQIKALIEYTRLQLDNPHQQALTFSLVKSLISRQIVLLQLFELMETIRTKMITSHHPSTRQQCRSAFVHFLLNYPMATKKLEEQLDFLLENIRYEFATGRESVVEVMGTLINRLPIEVIESISEAWFVGFAVQLSKETSSTDGSSVVIDSILSSSTLLFNRLPVGKRKGNLETLLLRWITQSPKLAVQGAAWKLAIPLIPQLSTDLKGELFEKAVVMIEESEAIPVDLLQIIIKFVQDLLIDTNGCKLNAETCNRLLEVTAQSRFYTIECDLLIRNAIASLWNIILKLNNNN